MQWYDNPAFEGLKDYLPFLSGMGPMLIDPVWGDAEHATAKRCELICVVEGNMTLHTPDGAFQAAPGDMLMVPAGMPHRDAFDPDGGLELLYCFFTLPEPLAVLGQIDNAALLALPRTEKARLTIMLDALWRRHIAQKEQGDLAIRAGLLELLLSMTQAVQVDPVEEDQAGNQSGYRKRQLMDLAQAFLQENYHRCLTLEDIADALDISPCYLSHIFSEQSGFSLFAYLNQLRMNRAAVLLNDGKLNVSEVARAVGYENANYFSKVFRKAFSCAPRDYARRAQAEC